MKPPNNPKNSLAPIAKGKVFDVSHPGMAAPDSSGRPLIVTHRPMIQDPMVTPPPKAVSDKSSGEPAAKPVESAPLPNQSKTKIEPLDGDPASPEPDAAESKPAQPEAASAPAEASEPPSETEQPEDQKPAAETAETDDDPSSQEPATQSAAAQKEAVEAARNSAEYEKLIEDRTYFVPINTVQRKRSMRFAVIGAIVIIIVAAACINFMLDAELLDLSGIPHTDLVQ